MVDWCPVAGFVFQLFLIHPGRFPIFGINGNISLTGLVYEEFLLVAFNQYRSAIGAAFSISFTFPDQFPCFPVECYDIIILSRWGAVDFIPIHDQVIHEAPGAVLSCIFPEKILAPGDAAIIGVETVQNPNAINDIPRSVEDGWG